MAYQAQDLERREIAGKSGVCVIRDPSGEAADRRRPESVVRLMAQCLIYAAIFLMFCASLGQLLICSVNMLTLSRGEPAMIDRLQQILPARWIGWIPETMAGALAMLALLAVAAVLFRISASFPRRAG